MPDADATSLSTAFARSVGHFLSQAGSVPKTLANVGPESEPVSTLGMWVAVASASPLCWRWVMRTVQKERAASFQ